MWVSASLRERRRERRWKRESGGEIRRWGVDPGERNRVENKGSVSPVCVQECSISEHGETPSVSVLCFKQQINSHGRADEILSTPGENHFSRFGISMWANTYSSVCISPRVTLGLYVNMSTRGVLTQRRAAEKRLREASVRGRRGYMCGWPSYWTQMLVRESFELAQSSTRDTFA